MGYIRVSVIEPNVTWTTLYSVSVLVAKGVNDDATSQEQLSSVGTSDEPRLSARTVTKSLPRGRRVPSELL